MMAVARMALALVLGLGGAQHAAAQADVCSGKSLLRGIEQERPEIWREALADFTAIPNAEGLLWKVEKAGSAPSWLFGTMHVPDPRVTSLKEPVAEAFAAAKVVVLESTEVTTDRDSQLALDMLELAQLPEGETFDAGFTAAEKDALGKLTAARGIPYFAARKLKPWFVAVSISIPACAQIAMMRGRPVLDAKLQTDAVAAGKELIGLETAAEQLEAIQGLDGAIGADSLAELARLGPEVVEDWYITMIDLYGQERPVFALPLMERMPDLAVMARATQDMQPTLIDERNLRMRDRLLPILEKGEAFVAVGAMHLSGETGLVELLRQSGYTVTRAD